MPKPPLVVVVGPTASGKSALAMRIAEKYDGEIVAADSRTIYRGMDIGTAKPTSEDQRRIPHHLLDIRSPDQSFSASEFKDLANAAIADIQARDKVPILVGGTGLYVDAVIFDYTFGQVADESRREELYRLSIEQLQALCRENNIEIPINNQNKRHLVRAVEIGGLFKQEKVLRSNTIVVGITTDRDILRDRVTKRTHQMLVDGVLDEVAAVGQKYGWKGESLKGNIYRIFRGVIEGTKDRDEATQEFIRSDMALAKRQMTWFRRNRHIQWSDSPEFLMGQVDTFLRHQSN